MVVETARSSRPDGRVPVGNPVVASDVGTNGPTGRTADARREECLMHARVISPALALTALLALMLATAAPAAAQRTAPDVDPVATDRLAGPDRIATSVAVSSDLAPERPEAVLARADIFPDALAGTVLATAAEGPLLLSRSNRLTPATAEELEQIMRPGSTVFLAGSEAALSAQVAADVRALGFTPRRVAGPDRYATAVTMAELANAEPQRIYIADGTTFADAAIAGHTAARDDFATMVLTAGDRLTPETAAYLDEHADTEVVAVGVVAASIGVADRSIVGPDQYATSVLAARELPTGDARVALATGEKFPDALSGGTHAALTRQPMLLVRHDELPAPVAGYLDEHPPGTITVYGSPAAISTPVVRAAGRARDAGGGALVFIDGDAPVGADLCEQSDGDLSFTLFESELTVELEDGFQATAMRLRAADRDGRTSDVEPIVTPADDTSAYRGTFDPGATGGIREVIVTFNVGHGLCR